MQIKTNRIISKVVLLFSLFFLLSPIKSLANNCCQITSVITGSNGTSSNFTSCKDDNDVSKETCVNKTQNSASGANNQTAVFFENSMCKDNKCVTGDKVTPTTTEVKLKPINFKFNIPLPGLPNSFIVDSNLLPTYITWLFKFTIGVAGLLAVFMITVGGLVWVFAGGNGSKISQAKNYITGAVAGLLLAVFSYSILYIINPKLTANEFPKIMNIQKASIVPMHESDYMRLTGGRKPASAELKRMAKEMSKKFNADYCAVLTILETESGGDPSAIGFDEDVRSSAIGSRRKFAGSGCKQTHSGQVVGGCSVGGNAMNDDRCMLYFSNTSLCPKGQSYYKDKWEKCDKEDLCLDWRYTRGIGLFQASVWTACDVNGQRTRCVDAGSKKFTPKQFLKTENQMTWFAAKWSTDYCPNGRDITNCWIRYSGSYNEFVAKKVAVYNECKKSN